MWNILYLEIVSRWLDRLDKLQLKSIAKEIKLLEICGNQLKLPHSKALGNGLFELRERTFGLRIYYTYLETGEILLLQGGAKKEQQEDIERARKRLLNFKGNNSESKKF